MGADATSKAKVVQGSTVPLLQTYSYALENMNTSTPILQTDAQKRVFLVGKSQSQKYKSLVYEKKEKNTAIIPLILELHGRLDDIKAAES